MTAPPPLALTAPERGQLGELAAGEHARMRVRARIVLRSAGGMAPAQIAAELGTSPATVRLWRTRFAARGLDGLRDLPRPGRPASRRTTAARMLPEQLAHRAPTRSGRWSQRALARATGVSPSTVGRMLHRNQQPSRRPGRPRHDLDRPPWSRPRDPGRAYYRGPRAMRALTHPARWALLHHLQAEGAATATDCASLVGLSVSATAYHLHQLARYHLAAAAPSRGDRRERVWQPLVVSLRMDDAAHDDPHTMHTVQRMIRASAEASQRRAGQWAATYPREPHEWRTASMFSYKALRTTPAELGTLYERIASLLQPYLANRRPSSRTPATARLIHVDVQMFPREESAGARSRPPPDVSASG